MAGAAWAAQAERELASMANVRLLRRAAVFGVYDGEYYGVAGARRRSSCAAPAVVHAAAAALENRGRANRCWRQARPNGRWCSAAMIVPGVMLASAVRTYVNRFAASPGRRVAVFTTNDDGWRTAGDLARAGIQVVAVIDPRTEVADAVRALATGCSIHLGARVTGCRGGRSLRAVRCSSIGNGRKQTLAADLLAVSGGWNPTIALATHLGGKAATGRTTIGGLRAGRLPPATWRWPARPPDTSRLLRRWPTARAGGRGRGADWDCGVPIRRVTAPDDEDALRSRRSGMSAAPQAKAFVDLQNDVTADGYRAGRARRLSLGRASQALHHARHGDRSGQDLECQRPRHHGRTAPAERIAADRHDALAAALCAGRDRRLRRPSSRQGLPPDPADRHPSLGERAGRVFVETGPGCGRSGSRGRRERDWLETVDARGDGGALGVGICDVSTLGKIDVQGPDAGALPRPGLHQHLLDACRSARRATG